MKKLEAKSGQSSAALQPERPRMVGKVIGRCKEGSSGLLSGSRGKPEEKTKLRAKPGQSSPAIGRCREGC